MRTFCAAAIFLCLSVSAARACGDARTWSDSYWRPTATDQNRQTALAQFAALCGGKTDAGAEKLLLAVLVDADRRQYPPDLLRRVLEAHRCLPATPRGDDLT